MRPLLLCMLCAFVPLWFISSIHADWPHVRGPNYDGVNTEGNLADTWPTDGPPRLWTRELGQGHSGFIIADGKLFTQRQTLGGQYLLCLDPDTGATIWEFRCDWAWQPKGAYPGPYATPTWYGGRVFYTSTSGLVGCVNAQTGSPHWSLNLKEKFKGKGFDFGYAITPLVEDDKVILPAGGKNAGLVALSVADGSTVWATGSDPASYCPALPITFEGRRCVVGYMQNALILVELATGKLVHRAPLSSGYDEHSAWPIYREPNLLLAAPFRAPASRFELSAGQDGMLLLKTEWISKEMSNDVVSSVLYEKHLYGFDLKDLQSRVSRPSRGSLKCLDWQTGKLCWATDDVGHASVLIADGKLLMLDDTGTLILARADPASYQELGRAKLFKDQICWTPPTLWQGKLFVRSPSQAVCINVGRTDQRPVAGGATPLSPAWRFDSRWLLSREREFKDDAPTWEEMTLWFAACVILVFGGAGLTAWGIGGTARRVFQREPSGALLYFTCVIVLGFLGPNALSALADQLLFTWPSCLYAAVHVAILACAWAEQPPVTSRRRGLARLAVLAFLLVGYVYYDLCNRSGMFIAWSFLIGFPFAFPFTVLAVRATIKERPIWIVAGWTLLAFAAFFWSAQVFLLWKTPS